MLFRPILLWPGKLTSGRRRSTFKATYQATLVLLDRELATEEAAAWLAAIAGNGTSPERLLTDAAYRQVTWRAVALNLHPDRGGDPEQFKKLQRVKELLDQ